jgi:hypothetical protein
VPSAEVDAFCRRCVRDAAVQYLHAHVEVLEVELTAVHPLSRVVSRQRITAARRFLSAIQSAEIAPFEPVFYRLPREHGYQLVLPPVVEVGADDLTVVIDGVHRLHAAWERKVERVWVVAVHGVTAPRPAEPANWRDVLVSPIPVPRRMKFHNLRNEHFRPVASRLRGSAFRVDTLDAVDALIRSGRYLSVTSSTAAER